MIIIAGYTRTEAHKRDAAIRAFAALVERARKYDGCLDLSISADSVDSERVNLFECWRDEESWNAWRKIAKAPAARPREIHVNVYRTPRPWKTFRRGAGKGHSRASQADSPRPASRAAAQPRGRRARRGE